MALTDDQKAMLRLLAQREEGYEDIAALMGIGVEEVRARVREALAAVEESEAIPKVAPEAPEPPPPPEVSEPPAPLIPPPPPPPEPSQPKVEEPTAPKAPRPARPALKLKLPKLKPPAGGGPRASGDNRGALIGLGAGAVVVVVLIVILAVGGGGGSSSSSTATSTESNSTTASESESESQSLTEAILSPSAGGSGSGRALFGRYKKNVLLQVEAEGLEPSPKGQAYTVWLYRSPKLALRVGAVHVGESGKIGVQFPVPAQVLAYVAGGAFDQVDVSLTSEATYKAELTKAKSEKRLPAYTGESVLRGEITGPAIKKQ